MTDDVLQRTIMQVAETKRIPVESVRAESTFQELGLDSLDAMNLLFALEEEFNVSIPDSDARAIHTVREASDGVAKLLAAKQGPAAERSASGK